MATMETVSIVGLGYVGLPLACLCAQRGLDVNGIDIDNGKIDLLSKGISPIDDKVLKDAVQRLKGKIRFSNDFAIVSKSSTVIICVPTPVDCNHKPDLAPLKKSCASVAKHIMKGTLVVVESTIFPGTVEEIVLPLLKGSGLTEEDFFLAHCPERIDPGNKKYNVSNLPRVVGGINPQSTKKAAAFYRKIIDADVVELSSVKAAEATKIMENAFRDVNIAFINEMAKSFDVAGIDIIEVIKGASTKPFAFMPHYPGAGVGGHCIPVDPYYLIEKAKQIGFNHKFLSLAREINNGMPDYAVELLESGLKKLGRKMENARVGVLGLAYKPDVDDMRESPSLRLIEVLSQKKAAITVFDPHVISRSDVKDLDSLLKKSEFLVLVTDHREFREMDIGKLKENGIRIVIDGRNCLDRGKIKSMGIIYHGIGRS